MGTTSLMGFGSEVTCEGCGTELNHTATLNTETQAYTVALDMKCDCGCASWQISFTYTEGRV